MSHVETLKRLFGLEGEIPQDLREALKQGLALAKEDPAVAYTVLAFARRFGECTRGMGMKVPEEAKPVVEAPTDSLSVEPEPVVEVPPVVVAEPPPLPEPAVAEEVVVAEPPVEAPPVEVPEEVVVEQPVVEAPAEMPVEPPAPPEPEPPEPAPVEEVPAEVEAPVEEVVAEEMPEPEEVPAEPSVEEVPAEPVEEAPEPVTEEVPAEAPIEVPAPVPVTDLEISDHLKELLVGAGVLTLTDVLTHPDLTEINGIGPANQEDILAAARTLESGL